MKFARVKAIARKQLLTLRHDKRTLALMLVAPVMAMLVFGFAFANDTKHVPVVVVNQDRGGLADKVIAHLDHEALAITTSQNLADAQQTVRDGRHVAALYFPAGFTAGSLPAAHQPAHFHEYIDTTNAQLAAVVQAKVPLALQAAAAGAGATSGLAVETDYAFAKAKDATSTDTLVPGIIAFAITTFTTLLTLLAFVSERTLGTLNRLRTTPVTEGEIVLGYELAFGLIAAVQGALLLAVGLLVYHILMVGPLWVAAGIVILTAIDAQAIGILISAAARRESQAVQFIPFIILPTFLLSGIFVAVSALPAWLQPFSYLLPPTWAIAAMRDVLLRGWGIDRVWPNLLVLFGFAIVFSVMAVIGLKRSRA